MGGRKKYECLMEGRKKCKCLMEGRKKCECLMEGRKKCECLMEGRKKCECLMEGRKKCECLMECRKKCKCLMECRKKCECLMEGRKKCECLMWGCVRGMESEALLKFVVESAKHASDRVTKWATLNIGEFGTAKRNTTCIHCLPDICALQKSDGFLRSVQQVHWVKKRHSVGVT